MEAYLSMLLIVNSVYYCFQTLLREGFCLCCRLVVVDCLLSAILICCVTWVGSHNHVCWKAKKLSNR